jgi:hypothetical protein
MPWFILLLRYGCQPVPDWYCTVSINGEKCATALLGFAQTKSVKLSIDCKSITEDAMHATCEISRR